MAMASPISRLPRQLPVHVSGTRPRQSQTVSTANGGLISQGQMLIAGDFHCTGRDDLIVEGEAFSGNGCDGFDPTPLPVSGEQFGGEAVGCCGRAGHFGRKVVITNEIAGFWRRHHALAIPQIRYRNRWLVSGRGRIGGTLPAI
jgi:hypothetical protein